MSPELISDLARLQVVIDHSVPIVLVDKQHGGLVVVQHHVGGLEHVTALVPYHRQVHQVLQAALIAILLIVVAILVDFDDGSIDDECPIVGECL